MVHSYRDKQKGYARTKTIATFGYLDELQKTHLDPIAHCQAIVDEHNAQSQQAHSDHTITIKRGQSLDMNTHARKNLGYIIIMQLFHALGLDRLLQNRRQRNTDIQCHTAAIMKLLVISRILAPASKKRTFESRRRYFDFDNKTSFDLVDIYRSLSHFATLEQDIQLLIHNRITKQYGRDLDLIYYDVTNYYFEIDQEDDLRRKGISKEHRPNPIVQLGLATDANGLPISYEVFAGNESEKLHLRPAVFTLRDQYATRRVIAVADAAQNTGNNIYYLDCGKQGYVFSQSIRGGSSAFKNYVTNEADYQWYGSDYKRKSRLIRREISVDFIRQDGTTGTTGTTYKKTVTVDQRQIVFYSDKYAARAKAAREAAITKAHKIAQNPSAYTRATSYGALKYVKHVSIDPKTKEVKPTGGTPVLDYDAICEEEKYDGYYAIVTNLFDEGKQEGQFTDEKIIDIYRGLWRVEDSFRITKSDLEARPIYLSRPERIKAHFLICFISLVILRLIQHQTNWVYSPQVLIEAMNNISCTHGGSNLFLFDYRSSVSDDLGQAFGIDFTNQWLTRAQIKKLLAAAKTAS